MIQIEFRPWHPFKANKKPLRAWLQRIANESEKAFKKGVSGPHSGRMYRNQASAPGEYPARQSGALAKSIQTRVTEREVTIGTGVFYSIFLRSGTRKMARRKMSDDALKEGMSSSRLGRWVEWTRL